MRRRSVRRRRGRGADAEFEPLDPWAELDPEEREWIEEKFQELIDERGSPSEFNEPPRCRARFRSRWSHERLQGLFERFAARYWPGLLAGWSVHVETIPSRDGVIAFCDRAGKRIVLDIARMWHSNTMVRAVLLHEMCHAASTGGHGLPFFRQVERLVARGVRVHVTWIHHIDGPDLGRVLATLPRCAASFRKALAVVSTATTAATKNRR